MLNRILTSGIQWILQRDMGIGTATAVAAGIGALSSGGQAIAAGKLNKKNRAWQEKMYGIQRGNALQDWNMQNEYNSPKAQLARLKIAGLNPALMYEGTGAGGQTATPVRNSDYGNPQTSVPEWGAVGMGIQQAVMMNAQIKLMEAQAKKTEQETVNLGEQKEQIIATTGNIKVDTDLKKIELKLKDRTFDDSVNIVNNELQMIEQNVWQQKMANEITDATQKTLVDQAKANLAATLMRKALDEQKISESKAGIQQMQSNIEVNNANIQALAQRIINETALVQQGQDRNSMQWVEQSYYRTINDVKDSLKLGVETASKLVNGIIGALGDAKRGPRSVTNEHVEKKVINLRKQKH